MSQMLGRRRQLIHRHGERSVSVYLTSVNKEVQLPRTAPIIDPMLETHELCDGCGKHYHKRGIATHRKHCKGVQT